MLAAQVFDLEPRIGLFQDPDNLRFTEPCPFHKNLLAAWCQKALLLTCPRFGEAYNLKLLHRRQAIPIGN